MPSPVPSVILDECFSTTFFVMLMNKVCIFINLESIDYILAVGLLPTSAINFPVLVVAIWMKLSFTDLQNLRVRVKNTVYNIQAF